MARPANADAEKTRRRLLDGAIRLFARDGFHGASTRELAASAKVNVATLSYYFASKQGLYDAAVDEVYTRLRTRTAEALAGAATLELDALLGRLYGAARAERDGIRLLVRQVLDGGRLTARTEERYFLPGLDEVTTLAAGLLRTTPQRARVAAVALTFMISRYVVQDDASLALAFATKNATQANERVVETLATTARALLAARPTHKE